jgi:alanyl-tRNA synthetase
VGPDYFRFDFSHFAKLTDEQLRQVENSVNRQIRANYPLEENRSATMDEAKAMGAIALFGEKYGDRVRVVKFGNSIELCGGCHVKATGQIGLFKILSESAIAAGVRRIEAVTGETAENYVQGLEDSLRLAKSLFNNVPDLEAAIRKTLDENTEYKKELEEAARQKTAELADELINNAKEINGVSVIKFEISLDPTMVRNASFILQKKLHNSVLAGAYRFDGKPCLILVYSDDMVAAGHNASKDIREAAKFIMGGGGGQPAIATAGGKNAEGLQEAMEKLIELATTK